MRRSTGIVVVLVVVIAIGAVAALYLLRSDDGDETSTTTTSQSPTTTSEPSTPGDTTAAPGAAPVFEEDSCEFDLVTDLEHRCGWVEVPEDRSDPDNGRSVRLHVAIFDSTNPDPPDDPIVYLDGGPGGESLSTLTFTIDTVWTDYLANREVIFFDQRGVGESTPSLDCPEVLEYELSIIEQVVDSADYIAGEQAALAECRERLIADGIDLSQFNSATNAADVADLRVALGYDEWNLLGVSYGTRLATTVMRDHPEGVRSVVLDSAYTPDVSLLTEAPENFVRALDVLFAGCAADPDCNEVYPDLEERTFALVDQLDAEPVTVPVRDVLNGEQYDVPVDGLLFLGALFQGLYSEAVIPVLPQMVDELEQGQGTTISLLLTNQLVNANFLSYGMHLSVQCNEEVPFTDPAELAEAVAEIPALEDYYDEASTVGPPVFDVCALWDAGVAAAVENQPITSGIPTLVMAGEYDPITPPRWGQRAAETLSNVTFVEFPGVGHAVSLSAECPASVALAFFDDPTAPVDASCAASMPSPAWSGAVEVDSGPLEMIPFEESVFGVDVSGVRPEPWDRVAPGTWARQTNATDQTMMVQQATPGELAPDLLLGVLASQLGLDEDPASAGTVIAGDRSWDLYESEIDGFPLVLAFAGFDGHTALVIMATGADEADDLYDQAFIPALEAFTIG